MLKVGAVGALVLGLAASGATAHAGVPANPIPVHMKRGTDSLRITGVLRRNVACCSYVFEAAAGQSLIWSVTGAAARETISYPDGRTDGPGLPNPIPLRARGAYIFAVSPDLMADGAFGRFVLTLKIPPLDAGPR